MSTLAERILRRMDELDMTQADLARKTGMTTANIAYIVNGKTHGLRNYALNWHFVKSTYNLR